MYYDSTHLLPVYLWCSIYLLVPDIRKNIYGPDGFFKYGLAGTITGHNLQVFRGWGYKRQSPPNGKWDSHLQTSSILVDKNKAKLSGKVKTVSLGKELAYVRFYKTELSLIYCIIFTMIPLFFMRLVVFSILYIRWVSLYYIIPVTS